MARSSHGASSAFQGVWSVAAGEGNHQFYIAFRKKMTKTGRVVGVVEAGRVECQGKPCVVKASPRGLVVGQQDRHK